MKKTYLMTTNYSANQHQFILTFSSDRVKIKSTTIRMHDLFKVIYMAQGYYKTLIFFYLIVNMCTQEFT